MAESVVRLSPRQKMINLMYIVLTAMLALNVSSDVLDGFVQVEDGLARTNATVGRRNDAVYSQLETFTAQNPGERRAVALQKHPMSASVPQPCIRSLIHSNSQSSSRLTDRKVIRRK